jgi:glycosyltransferase involved in cell wall biosynthesis
VSAASCTGRRRPVLGVITSSYPRWAGDPAGNFVAGHVEALRALGHEVEVIAATDASRRSTAQRALRDDAGLFYTGGAPDRLEAAPWRGVLAGLGFTARMTAEVTRRSRRWELAIAHWLVPSAMAALPARVPLLAIAHGGDVHTLHRMGLLGWVLRALHARRARLVFVSDRLRALARAAAPDLDAWLADALVQPMGIEIDRFHDIARQPADPPCLVLAGRLVAIKGIDVAIAAMAHVRTPARLVIAGDGPERDRLASAAPPSVAFLGEVTPDRRDRLLGEASAVIVPSRILPTGRTEGTPTVALEALAAGVPVIASAVGGLGELGALTLVPPEDPRALAHAIDQTLARPPSPVALRQAVAHLDWPLVARRLLDSAS